METHNCELLFLKQLIACNNVGHICFFTCTMINTTSILFSDINFSIDIYDAQMTVPPLIMMPIDL